MLETAEAVTAAAWDVASVAFADDEQWAYAADVAGAVALDGAVRNAQACIQVLGGIGFTFEHDAHFYLRRATGLRSLLGSAGRVRIVAGGAGHGRSPPPGRGRPGRARRRRAGRRTRRRGGDRRARRSPSVARRWSRRATSRRTGPSPTGSPPTPSPSWSSTRSWPRRESSGRTSRSAAGRRRRSSGTGTTRSGTRFVRPDAAGRADLVPAVQRARRRDPTWPRCAPAPQQVDGRLAADRAEGLDVAGARGRLGDLPGPDRPGCAAAPGHLLLPGRHARPTASTYGRCAS